MDSCSLTVTTSHWTQLKVFQTDLARRFVAFSLLLGVYYCIWRVLLGSLTVGPAQSVSDPLHITACLLSVTVLIGSDAAFVPIVACVGFIAFRHGTRWGMGPVYLAEIALVILIGSTLLVQRILSLTIRAQSSVASTALGVAAIAVAVIAQTYSMGDRHRTQLAMLYFTVVPSAFLFMSRYSRRKSVAAAALLSLWGVISVAFGPSLFLWVVYCALSMASLLSAVRESGENWNGASWLRLSLLAGFALCLLSAMSWMNHCRLWDVSAIRSCFAAIDEG